MAGTGPAPKPNAVRRNKPAQRDLVKYDGVLRGFELPDASEGDLLPPVRRKVDGEWVQEPQTSWHRETVKWWERWRSSPQAMQMMTEVDWSYLLDTALMHNAMWRTGSFESAGEVRQRMSMFGATPQDRMRLRMEVEVPAEQYPAGRTGQSGEVASIDDARRKRLADG